MTAPLLSVRGLSVSFPGRPRPNHAVQEVSLDLYAGETLGLVGESGCGKTITALTILGLQPRRARVESGQVRYRETELLGAPLETLRKVRGAEIGMVFQEPSTTLHPTLPIGFQIAEAIRAHHPDFARADVDRRVIDLLDSVEVPDPARRALDYPQAWSGGMRQRAVLAMAIANRPRIIIADEPTTALDVTIQAQVLALLRRLCDESGAALLLISHDLGVIAELADRVAVMYSGRIVETAPADRLFAEPRHPYTAGLIDSIPRLSGPVGELPFIPGRPPDTVNLGPACPFAPRCRLAEERCRSELPQLQVIGNGGRSHLAACFFSTRVSVGRRPLTEGRVRFVSPADPLLVVEDLKVHYRRGRRTTRAVDGVSFRILPGETLALVGESGCGKTSTARAVLGLVAATAGSVRFRGRSMEGQSDRRLRSLRRELQAVFQDPYGSLNPRHRVADIIGSPLRIHHVGTRAERDGRVAELMDLVGLGSTLADRFPSALSGGQRQRVSIARALALNPALLVLDEPLSSLDLSIQAQIINLLRDLQAKLGLAYLFIGHDLAAVRHLADRVAVMYLGRIVEMGTRDEIFEGPRHPYTRALLSAVPRPDPTADPSRRIVLVGDVPGSEAAPAGCRFASRCYQVEDLCRVTEPELGDGCACYFPLPQPKMMAGPG